MDWICVYQQKSNLRNRMLSSTRIYTKYFPSFSHALPVNCVLFIYTHIVEIHRRLVGNGTCQFNNGLSLGRVERILFPMSKDSHKDK